MAISGNFAWPMLVGLTLLGCGSDSGGGGGTGGGGAAGGRGGQGGAAVAGRGGAGGSGGSVAGSGGSVAGSGGSVGGTGGATGGSGGGTGGIGGSGGTAGTGGTGGTGGGTGGSGNDAMATPDLPPDLPPAAARTFVYVGSDSSAEIRIFELNLQTGAMTARGGATSGPAPNYIAFHPTGKFLYAISESTGGGVYAFSINTDTGALTRLNNVGSGGQGPAHLSVHKSGKWLFTANYGSGHAGVIPIMPDGRLGSPVAPSVRAGGQAHMITDDRTDGKFVFVPSKMDLRTLMFRFDEATGALTGNSPAFVNNMGPARHMTFDRTRKYAYVLTEGGGGGRRVWAYKYDATSGLLTEGVAVDAGDSGNGAHILAHPTRDFVYASIRASSIDLAIFRIGPDGRLQALPAMNDGIDSPWDFDIDPSGQYAIVGEHSAANVRVFRINQETGALTKVGGNVAVNGGPRTIAILAVP